jgi:hypothetical protein
MEFSMHARFVPRLTARLVAAAFITLLAAACEHLPTEPGSLASIVVTRNPDSVAVTLRRNFTATGYDANGTVVGINPVWSAAAGGTIASSGAFTAGNVPGTYANSIKATVGSLSGTATVVVLAGAAATITVTPATTTLPIAGQQQYVAVVKDAGGNVVPGTPIWSAQVGVGTISATGLFSAGNVAGTFPTAITASMAGLTGTAAVTITPGALATVVVTPNPAVLAIGALQQFVATGRDINNNVVPFTAFWSVQALGGTIDSTGKFTAGTVAGTYANTIRACNTLACPVGSISGFATVTVTAGALATLIVTPNPVTVGTNARVQFTAIGRDANGNIIPVLPLPTWSVLPGKAGGTILSGGGYTAPASVGVGIDTVVATSGALTGSARVNIVASPQLVTMSVTPNPANLALGAIQQFTATGVDANGVTVAIPNLQWTVVNGGGTIDINTGIFTAGNTIGVFPNTVKATSGAIFAFATVNVGTLPPTPAPNYLNSAATYGILAGASVTCAGAPASITGDVAISPGSTINGFPPCTISGATHYGDPIALAAQNDLTAAYIALTALPCTATITADLGGTTLAAGVYCTGGSVAVTGELKLTGTATDVFVIRAGSTVTTAGYVTLLGSVSPKNVYFVAGSSITLGTPPLIPALNKMQGSMIALTSVTLVTGENLFGRALARNGSVTLGVNTNIIVP